MSQRKFGENGSGRQDGLTDSRKISMVRDHTDTFRRKDTVSEMVDKRSMVGPLGSSMATFMSTKRVARKLTHRLLDRGGSWGNRSRTSHVEINVPKEPSYRMEPHKKFNSAAVRNIIKDSLEDRLEGFTYTPEGGARVSKILTDEIKEKVKVQNFDRYKVVCIVTLGEKTGQCLLITSRCAWDDQRDNFSTYTYDTPNIYCTATVYGVYNE